MYVWVEPGPPSFDDHLPQRWVGDGSELIKRLQINPRHCYPCLGYRLATSRVVVFTQSYVSVWLYDETFLGVLVLGPHVSPVSLWKEETLLTNGYACGRIYTPDHLPSFSSISSHRPPIHSTIACTISYILSLTAGTNSLRRKRVDQTGRRDSVMPDQS